MAPYQPASYSLNWANNVVKQLENKYPRALNIFCKNWEISTRILAKYLAKNDPVYAYLRERIKFLDKRIQRGNYNLNKLQYLEWERGLLALSHGKNWKERLDKYLESVMLKEQVDKGVSGGRKPDGNLPSSSYPTSEVNEYGEIQYCLPFSTE